ncbi:MAG: bifunctional GTP diphosphokinase/guanosine-3',5'-bis pyrophosphate 3'-pyrophosphohydrolase [Gammaproteobacteria bacterium]|nr:bifunctional GTP diphosphokinase/guanosine-3',5'-bis pyrophosphate 3'-pyrophosphohydrolase [Gammaproteobacteria bacterium]
MSTATPLAPEPALRIDDLCRRTRAYLSADQIRDVRRAYRFSAEAHEGQKRQSGEPYVQHPLEVAGILAEMHMDHETLIAAMLHDVIEDTRIAKERISEEFGAEVAQIVDGLSKLTQIEFESHAEAQAQNFQKMLMAMADDIRVILVKLADRVHNMRTLGALRPDKRRRIARETLEIYAPIAQRLGMNAIRLELEELGFEALYPLRYGVLTRVIQKIRGNRKEVVAKIKNRIKRQLRQEQLVAHVAGREKHLYSIYNKMREKHLHFSEVHDVYAFRIIVDSVDTCYRTLGVVHSLYKPVPGTFKDYIAIPKANGYQSLHTVLFGPFGVPIEVQIRTNEMDQVAEAGIAAHWLYKTGESAAKSAHKRAREWLRGVIEMQRRAGNSQEFLENVKVDLFPDEVYVFTPKGEIMELPRGATAVDLAYAIHTDLGNTCVGCRVDRRLAPLRTPLKNGDTVEIVTAPGARPNPAWLTFVVTGKARANIRHYLKNLRQDEATTLGKRMLNRELERFEASIDTLDEARVKAALASFNLASMDELLSNIGLGIRPAPLVARALVPSGIEDRLEDTARRRQRNDGAPAPLLIHGTEGMVVTIPKCCYPIPGDPIMGFITAGRGIVIHHPSCKNVVDFRNAPDKWVDVEWADDLDREFSAEIVLDVQNQRGVLATVAAGCADQNANIEGVELSERDEHYSKMRLVIGVRDRKHLADVIRVLRNIKTVSRVHRKRA